MRIRFGLRSSRRLRTRQSRRFGRLKAAEAARPASAQLGGVDWPKSACTFCPFALANTTGRARVLNGLADHPDAAVVPLLMEYTANAFNLRQALLGRGRLLDHVKSDPRLWLAWQTFKTAATERD